MNYSYRVWILLLGFAGVAFSGYLSGVKFFSQTCAFGETCPLFFGYPACYVGFALFVLILLSAMMLYTDSATRGRAGAVVFSLVGVLFAGYYTLAELPLLMSQGLGAYVLGLPTCAMGLVVFVGVFVFALLSRPTERA